MRKSKAIIRSSAGIAPLYPILAGAVLLASSANAALLATYSVSGGSLAASGVNSIITATNITNTGVTGGFGVSNGSSTLFLRASETGGNTLTNAISENDYVQFTVTPTGSNLVSLSSVSLDHLGSVNNNVGAFNSSLSVFASIAGVPTFSSGNELGTSTVPVADSSTGGAVLLSNDATFNLGASFQNLTSANTVTFRIYGFDNASSSDQINRLNDVKINGDLVPEPSTTLLIGISALGLLRRRRA